MPTEKVMHRTGQVLGAEKRYCEICKKETNQNVIYFLTKMSSAVIGSFGIMGALINTARFNIKAPDGKFIGYVCTQCGSLSIPKEQSALMEKYGWSSFWGFKGKPKGDVAFKVWKLD